MSLLSTHRKSRILIAVLGPWRSGTSAVTGMLRGFGVYVGSHFYDANTGYCTYEDQLLRKACLAAFDERPDEWGPRGNFGYRASLLRSWYIAAAADAERLNLTAIGGKHPIMCMLVNELVAATQKLALSNEQSLRIVSVERDQQEIVRSWTRDRSDQTHWWPRPDIERVVAEMDEARSASLGDIPHLSVRFPELKSDPQSVAKQLATHFGFDIDLIPRALSYLRN